MPKNKSSGASSGVVRVPLIACIAAAALVAVGITQYVRVKNNAAVSECSAKISATSDQREAVVSDINYIVDTPSGVAKVYDSLDRLIFQLNYSEGLCDGDSLPEYFIDSMTGKILGGSSVKQLDINAWIDSHKLLGDALTPDYTDGSLGYVAVQKYCTATSVSWDNDAMLIVASYLDENYSPEELLTYICCRSSFGGYSGVSEATLEVFNKYVSDLNEAQLDYICYLYENPDGSFSDFKEVENRDDLESVSEEAFGIDSTGGSTYWLIKDYVAQELLDVLATEVPSDSINVKLELNSSLQAKLQELIDSGLKASVSLDSSGQTSVDGIAGVVDPNTGFVTALVAGRSVNTVQRELSLSTTSLIGNYKAAAAEFEKDPTLSYATLVEVEGPDGSKSYAQFGSLVAMDRLGSMGISPVVEKETTLEELLEFGTSMYIDASPRFISEVQSSSGEVLYKAEAGENIASVSPSPDLRALLMNTYTGDSAKYMVDSDVGSAYGVFTSEYVVGVLCGTNTAGYSFTYEDADACATTALSVVKAVGEFYPRTPQPIDPVGSVASKVQDSQKENATVVSEIVASWVTQLDGMVIDSVGARSEFETSYYNCMSQLQMYAGLVSDELLLDLYTQLESVRLDRTEDLLNFVA